MNRSSHAFLLAASLLSASLIGSCGGKVVEGGATSDSGVSTGGSGGSGVGGTVNKGGMGGLPQGGHGGVGASGYGGSGWGGGNGSGWGGAGGSIIIDAGPNPYGYITSINFSTKFLLDSDKLNDNAYIQAHQNAIGYGAAFTGYYGLSSKPIPPQQGQTINYGVHSPAYQGYPPSVQITQYSLMGQNQVLNPFVEFYFATDDIKPGIVDVGYTQTSGAYLILYNDINNGQDYCILAIAVGSVQVTDAQNTTAKDGGVLAFVGKQLPLYYPKETPYGDLSSQGIGTICVKE